MLVLHRDGTGPEAEVLTKGNGWEEGRIVGFCATMSSNLDIVSYRYGEGL